MCKILAFLAVIFAAAPRFSQNRWKIANKDEIFWDINGSLLPHSDHIEISGIKSSVWLQYTVDTLNKLHLRRTIVFPGFRTNPYHNHATHASLMKEFSDEGLPAVFLDKYPVKAKTINGIRYGDMEEKNLKIRLNGSFTVESDLFFGPRGNKKSVHLTREIFPSASRAAVIEQFRFENKGSSPVTVSMEGMNNETIENEPVIIDKPIYLYAATVNEGTYEVNPGEQVTTAVVYHASYSRNALAGFVLNQEKSGRDKRIGEIAETLCLETPDTTLNTLYEFAKRRTTESIYELKCGLIHSPGGLSYYAAIWANDQAEYTNPFFGYLGDKIASQAALNSFSLFARYMNSDFTPIPSSIVSEGDAFWGGAGDRGDMAMIAYGASRFALAYANADTAKKLLPLIEWCLGFCRRKINADGVVASNTDELEGRFPAGDANLCTSSLYYDALISTAFIYISLKQDKAKATLYLKQAKAMHGAIEKHFGATMDGFETYRYYAGNDKLRSWICIPLTMGIFDRKEGTVKALFSPKLWTNDGLASQAGDITFWDRSTLYGFRGVLAAGNTETAMPYLKKYSERRLLGEHVPYPVEAFPEGNQRHLAAESALYCRVFTEGLFGIRPAGFDAFYCTPHLPAGWDHMALKNINAFGNSFDLWVNRQNELLIVSVIYKNREQKKFTLKSNETVFIRL